MSIENVAQGQDGFALVEVLCAFAILSLGVGLAFQSVQLATTSMTIAEEKTRVANLIPQIQLKLSAGSDAEASIHGEVNGFQWKAQSIHSRQRTTERDVALLELTSTGSHRAYRFLVSVPR